MDTDKYVIWHKHAQDVMVWLELVPFTMFTVLITDKKEQSKNL